MDITSPSGTATSGRPIKKCPDVKTSKQLGSLDKAVSGLEFKQASTCANVVLISSKVKR